MKVLIGDNAVVYDGFGKFVPMRFKACNLIEMDRRPDGVFVNASLFDAQGQAVVAIKDNRITALNGENYSARQTQDESVITIRNRVGTELFYVHFLNPTTVQARGFFGCLSTPMIQIRDNQPVPGLHMRDSCVGSGFSGVGIQIGKP